MNVWQCYHHWSVTVHILWTSLELKCLPRYVVYCILAYQGISSVYILILGTSYQGRTENKVRCMQVRFTLQLQQIRNAATCAHTHAACYMITLPERQNVHEETITQCSMLYDNITRKTECTRGDYNTMRVLYNIRNRVMSNTGICCRMSCGIRSLGVQRRAVRWCCQVVVGLRSISSIG
jgi:hypothetical protein